MAVLGTRVESYNDTVRHHTVAVSPSRLPLRVPPMEFAHPNGSEASRLCQALFCPNFGEKVVRSITLCQRSVLVHSVKGISLQLIEQQRVAAGIQMLGR